MNRIASIIARCLQALLAGFLLVALLPVMLLIAILIRISSKGPVIFTSWRIGQRGTPFRIYKFRTMTHEADQVLAQTLAHTPEYERQWQQNVKLDHDPRITPFGRVLRKTSLDELPQLYNVLIGDMNFIGPRPIVEEERKRYGERFTVVNAIKPGITGLWQVSGRNDLSYEERIELDVLYATRHSLAMNAMIFCKTFHEIIAAHGK